MKQHTLERRLYMTLGSVILLMAAISMMVTLYYSIMQNRRNLDQAISNMALVLSRSPLVVDTLEGRSPQEILWEYLDGIQESASSLDVVTVCNMEGIRVYHRDKAEVGKYFTGGDEKEALGGRESYITDGVGTLGPQRRAFHVVRNRQGQPVGFVMAAVLTENLRKMYLDILKVYAVMAAVVLAMGAVQVRHHMQRLKKVLMGYRPEELATKYVERSEVLDMLEEGIFAAGPDGRVILMNRPARQMLGIGEDRQAEGRPLKELYPDTKLLEVMESGRPQHNVSLQLNGNHILASRIPLMEHGKTAGAITIFRDKTEAIRLAEQLTGTSDMVDTLRAFNHEFMNKLHVILGYLQLGQCRAAMEFIMNTTLVSGQAVVNVTRQIGVPHLSALVIGKMMKAGELGIGFHLTPDSFCGQEYLLMPVDCYVTLVGNLLENAIEELNSRDYPVKEISLGIYCDGKGTMVVCTDTGGGIPEEVRENMFRQGFSTKGRGRGTGMALVRNLADQYHGTVEVETEAGEGTCITVSFQTCSRQGG
ncbi:MAG: sensor histidine kinase [Lachnospiraceae bacterium]|nr:sensor histidine kinase [Lachnospiraceae bacterium]